MTVTAGIVGVSVVESKGSLLKTGETVETLNILLEMIPGLEKLLKLKLEEIRAVKSLSSLVINAKKKKFRMIILEL